MKLMLVVSQYSEIYAALIFQMEQYMFSLTTMTEDMCMTVFRDREDDFTPTSEYKLNQAHTNRFVLDSYFEKSSNDYILIYVKTPTSHLVNVTYLHITVST
jgi:hypothetical protein